MATNLGKFLTKMWSYVTGRVHPAPHDPGHTTQSGASPPIRTEPKPLAASSAAAPPASPTLPAVSTPTSAAPDTVAPEAIVHRDRLLARRIEATARLNRRKDRKGVRAASIVVCSRRATAIAKSVAPRRHVALVARAPVPATTGVVIRLPTTAERTRTLSRAA